MQDSLPAAGPALPGGIGYPQGSCERFHGCNDSPFPSFLARCRFVFSGKNDELTPDLTPDFCKRKTLANEGDVVSSSPGPSAAVIIAEESANIQRTVKREIQDEMDKAILQLRFFKSRCMTNRDIAQTLGLSEATVSRRLDKIYERLRGQPEFQPLVAPE